MAWYKANVKYQIDVLAIVEAESQQAATEALEAIDSLPSFVEVSNLPQIAIVPGSAIVSNLTEA